MESKRSNDTQTEDRAPLAEAVLQYANKQLARLHFPGHKGVASSNDMACLLGNALKHDLTELPGLDDLAAPSDAIAEAQRLAARAFGASHTFFLVGGASVGVVASVWAAVRRGDSIALARNCHRSAVSALVLSGAVPRWVRPSFLPEIGVFGPCPLSDLYACQTSAVLALSPTYEGLCSETWRKPGCTLIVDEAHGSHFYWHDSLPKGALVAGADAVVHGAHKTLGSLTGTGMLHLADGLINPESVRELLLHLQTSSPSYLMLASLDLARRDMAVSGRTVLERVLHISEDLRRSLFDIGVERFLPPGIYDPTKVVIPSLQFGLSGPELSGLLWEHSVAVEYSGLTHITASLGPGDAGQNRLRHSAGDELVRAISAVKREAPGSRRPSRLACAASRAAGMLASLAIPEQSLTPRQVLDRRRRTIPFREASGFVSAESIFAYPPAAPLLVQGEVVPEGLYELITSMKDVGVHLQGLRDQTLGTLSIVEE